VYIHTYIHKIQLFLLFFKFEKGTNARRKRPNNGISLQSFFAQIKIWEKTKEKTYKVHIHHTKSTLQKKEEKVIPPPPPTLSFHTPHL